GFRFQASGCRLGLQAWSLPTPKPKVQGPKPKALRDSLYCERDAVASAQARRRDPALEPFALQGMNQRSQYARPARSNGMTKSDRTTVDVHSLGLDPKLVEDGHDLGGKGLVELEEVHVLQRPADLVQQTTDRLDRSHEHELGSQATRGLTNDARQRSKAQVGSPLGRHHGKGRRTVAYRRRISRTAGSPSP